MFKLSTTTPFKNYSNVPLPFLFHIIIYIFPTLFSLSPSFRQNIILTYANHTKNTTKSHQIHKKDNQMNDPEDILVSPIPSYPSKKASVAATGVPSRRRRHHRHPRGSDDTYSSSSDGTTSEEQEEGIIYKIVNHFYNKSPLSTLYQGHQQQQQHCPPSISPSLRDEDGGLMRTPLSTSQRRYVQSRQSLIPSFIPIPKPFSGSSQSGNTSPSLSMEFFSNLISHGTSSRDYFLKCISNLINTVSTGVYNGITNNIATNDATDTFKSKCIDNVRLATGCTSDVATTNGEKEGEEKADLISEESKNTIKDLAEIIKSGCSVLFVTGAGVSVGSGVPTYRTGEDGIWNKYIYEWGTKEKFLSDPTTWWNDFWFKTHDINPERVLSPCAAHYAITDIMREYPNVNLVTQNVDRLHLKSGADPSRVIEIHGAMDVYRCSNRSCKYASEECIEGVVFEKSADGNVIPPHCPECGAYVLPMTLLFDELYSSHSFFRKKTFQDWLDRADVVVFVGTSFSVNVTLEVLRVAALWDTEIFNFNVEPKGGYGIKNIMGPSEVLLPELAKEAGVEALGKENEEKKKNGIMSFGLWSVLLMSVMCILLVCFSVFSYLYFFFVDKNDKKSQVKK